MIDKLAKWNEAYQDADIESALAAQVLQENDFLLPCPVRFSGNKRLKALDLACGRGGNAIFLARRGFDVDAVDISPVVLDHLTAFAQKQSLPIHCIRRDIESQGLPEGQYDVIAVSYFLCRHLFAEIVDALKPDALLFYQTWSQQAVDKTKGPSSKRFRLAESELLTLSKPLVPVFYRENGLLGDTSRGLRNEAMLIARKTS